ncbi:MAG: hypothetical protein Cons2KO_24400 [Congregibacter sp.]
MTYELITGLAVFSFVSSITPGPNNLMLMASGANFGFRRSLPHMLGVGLGFAFMVLLIALGVAQLFERFPTAYTVLKVLSVAYMLWLAWKIATAGEPGQNGDGGGQPLTFLQAAAFQWVNPKAWTMGLTAVTVYSLGHDIKAALVIALVFGTVNLPCISVWTLLGLQIKSLLTNRRRLTSFNVGMALLLLLSLYPVLGASLSQAETAATREVTVLFTNDFESAYDPIEAFWRDDIDRIGGIAELATLVKSIRQTRSPVFLFDAGDIFTGSLARRTHGAVALDLMQLLKYDAMAIGNHEFEYGWEIFSREKARAPFPVLGANLFYAGTSHPYAQPWAIVERDGVRIAVVGILGQDAATALIPSNIAGLEVKDPAEVLRPLVARLRPEADLVVVLVHQGQTAPMQTDDEADPAVYRGNQANLNLAGAVPGIDIILAGHADAGTPQALVHPESGTLIMQTWGQGQHLGELRLELDADGNIHSYRSRLIPVDADKFPPDPTVARRLAMWRADHADLREINTHATAPIVRRYYQESPLGNLFADVLRDAIGADIALMPSGALRRDLPAGPVRRVDILDAFPFEDHNALVTVSGKVLREILEQGFSLERGLLQVSGMRIAFDPGASKGSRVKAVCIGEEPLDKDHRYTVATLEILAQGGDAYVQFLEADDTRILPQRFADTLEKVLGEGTSIEPPELNRIVLAESGGTGQNMQCAARLLPKT